MRDLLRGTIALRAYVQLLQNLAALYEAMEAEIDRNVNHPALHGVDWNTLRRFPALQHDIAQLAEYNNRDGAVALSGAHDVLVPATHLYVKRLRELGSHTPELLFAHAYLRYLATCMAARSSSALSWKR